MVESTPSMMAAGNLVLALANRFTKVSELSLHFCDDCPPPPLFYAPVSNKPPYWKSGCIGSNTQGQCC